MASIQITKIENGYLVQVAAVVNPQTGQMIAPPKSWSCVDFEEVCVCIKQFFPPSLIH